MTARLRATWTKLTHDAAQPVIPVAGSKGFAITSNALDKDFFGGIGDHQAESYTRAMSLEKSHAALQKQFYLIEDSTSGFKLVT